MDELLKGLTAGGQGQQSPGPSGGGGRDLAPQAAGHEERAAVGHRRPEWPWGRRRHSRRVPPTLDDAHAELAEPESGRSRALTTLDPGRGESRAQQHTGRAAEGIGTLALRND